MQARLTCLVVVLAALLLPGCQEDTVLAPALSATCEARPSSGAAPLTVVFLLSVAGAEGPVTVAISYGDGQSGTNPDATHIYAAAGSYTASMTVTTVTQNARCSAAVAVSGSPQAGGNKEPNGVFKTAPTAVRATITGQAPLTVTFNMCASSDPEGDELYFLMDFDGDGRFEFGGITGFHCRADRVYALGTWRPVMCLYDRDANRKALHDDLCQKFTVVATP
jgi:PKD repeat protein